MAIGDSARLAQNPAKVFISHDSRDREIARDLSRQLLDAGFGVWLDAICLIAGQRFEYEIRGALETTDAVIVLVSPGSEGKTGFIQHEIRLVLEAADSRPDGAIFLIPVLIDGAAVPGRFAHLHCIRADGEGWFHDLRYSLGESTLVQNVRSGGGPADVRISSVRLAAGKALRGDSLTMDYVIRSFENDLTPIELGASLVGPDDQEYFERREDRRLLIARGTAAYRRRLRVPPEAPPGTYQLVAAVWSERIGEQHLSTVDCGAIDVLP